MRLRDISAGQSVKREDGFTLIELVVVMAIIAILASLAVPIFTSQIKKAREAVLQEDLHVMRNAIDSYTMDKGKAPESLDDLVQAGYLRSIPVDPMTQSRDTWVTDSGDTYESVDQSETGINDVHSGSQDVGTNGKMYSTW
ncbi:MAG TPA: prepilin-type N-terminal cleavage/methylation domain-containing protein [Acidobacteriaceae bacterium]|nr:prepilin-type N-terminal cleavage/methylation domain-containing protein [Acidobacteriaceae bacterium]